MLTVVTTPRRVALISPYLPRMVERCRQLDGHWSEEFSAWLFRVSAAQAVRNAARRHYQQVPDSFHLTDHPEQHPTIAHLAIETQHPDTATEADVRHRSHTLPIGLLLHTSRISHEGKTRWSFADGSAVIHCDHEFFPGVHESRREFDSDPYATLYLPDHMHLAIPKKE